MSFFFELRVPDYIDQEAIDQIDYSNKILQNLVSNLSDSSIPMWLINFSAYNQIFAPDGLKFVLNLHSLRTSTNKRALHDISSHVFAALSDEFRDTSSANLSHYIMADMFKAATKKYYKTSISHDNEMIARCREIISYQGYNNTQSRDINFEEIIFSLGFHFAVERNGVIEFRLIDEYLKEEQPEFVSFCKNNIDENTGVSSYRWIELQTELEIDHMKNAITALELAKNLYKTNDNCEKSFSKLSSSGFKTYQKSLNFFNLQKI